MTVTPIAHRFDDGARPTVQQLVMTGTVCCQRCGRPLVQGNWTLQTLIEEEQTHIATFHSGRLTPRQLREQHGLPEPQAVAELPSRRPSRLRT